MAVPLSADVLARYERFSLYNSPFAAHDRGCAIDLYDDPERNSARSPVAGEVIETRTVRAPPKSYAENDDYLILVDCADRDLVARLLHVEPIVEPGDGIEVGDRLGRLVRAGFFAPWVDDHVHLGFRAPGANPYRAAGSLAIAPERAPLALDWDGSGTVLEGGRTYAILDAPTHPDPDSGRFAGVGASLRPTDADGSRARSVVLDGGLAHYENGGVPAGEADSWANGDGQVGNENDPRPIEFLGTEIGIARGRTIDWHSLTVTANGRPITGLSLDCARGRCGVKLVCPETTLARGDRVTVSLRRE